MDLPHWPAMMRRQLAARYCDLSVADFLREVEQGRLPDSVATAGGERWNRRAIDAALDRIAGGEEDWRAKLGLNRAA